MDLCPGRKDEPPFPPGIGMQHQRRATSPDPAEQALKTAVMVGV